MIPLPPPLNPPVRLLMGPGPSEIHPRVLRALAANTVGHLDPYYLSLMSDMQGMLRTLFRTQNPMTMAISATGSAGMESTVVNLIEPGDSMIVCVNGVFGERMVDVAGRAGANVTRVDRPWGEVFEPSHLKEALAKAKPKVVGIVMAETSTGALQPLEEISNLVHDAGALLLVDAVTALGGVPVEVDKWKIDAIYSGTQKCLSCPPGLAPASFSPAALEVVLNRKTKVQSWYLDLQMVKEYWGGSRAYHHTAPINMNYGLHAALRCVLEEGLEQRWARHAKLHLVLRAGLEALGLSYVVAEPYRLPMLNSVRIPDGIDDAKVRSLLLQEFGLEIGGGLGPMKGKVWRIGLMGAACTAKNVVTCVSALEYALRKNGSNVNPGAGPAAVTAALLA